MDEARLDEIVTEGFSGAEVAALCKDAALRALEKDENMKAITLEDLKDAAKRVKPQITQQVRNFYAEFARRHRMS
jgi:SpoVK/Ycf46/Vps4 family AAA+-type ATPase